MILTKPNICFDWNDSVCGLFSFVKNIERYLDGKSTDLSYDHYVWFSRVNEYTLKPYKKMFSYFSSSVVNRYDLFLYYLMNDSIGKFTEFPKIKIEDLKNVRRVLSRTRYRQDKKILEGLVEKMGNTLIDLFIIEESGTNLLYELVYSEKISVITYIILWRKYLSTLRNFDNLSEEMERFHNRLKIIAYTMDKIKKGVSDEQ